MRIKLWAMLLLPFAAVGFVAMAVSYFMPPGGDVRFWSAGNGVAAALPEFYAKNLRGSLFAGFLTLGGFLMSLKAFIVVNMKKEVFDSAAYKKAWDEAKARQEPLYSTKFQPLRDLASVIFFAVASCIGCAVTQLTIGLFPNIFACLFALGFACVAIVFVLRTLLLIRTNLSVLFDYLDEGDA